MPTRTVSGRKKPRSFDRGLVLALRIFPASSKDCRGVKNVPVARFSRKKLHPFGWSSLCWRYLSSRPVTRQVLSAKVCLTSVFGMGTGGPTPQSTPTSSERTLYHSLRPEAQSSLTPSFLLSKSKQVLILSRVLLYTLKTEHGHFISQITTGYLFESACFQL